jgi:hypothetical protein
MEPGHRFDANDVARRVADAVGDGSVVLVHEPEDVVLRGFSVAV